jgi:hypothetical protein
LLEGRDECIRAELEECVEELDKGEVAPFGTTNDSFDGGPNGALGHPGEVIRRRIAAGFAEEELGDRFEAPENGEKEVPVRRRGELVLTAMKMLLESSKMAVS